MVVSGRGVVEVVVCAGDSVVVAKDVSPAIVVRDLGTRVHLFPFIDVIVNPSGRFAFVDMVEKEKRHQSL